MVCLSPLSPGLCFEFGARPETDEGESLFRILSCILGLRIGYNNLICTPTRPCNESPPFFIPTFLLRSFVPSIPPSAEQSGLQLEMEHNSRVGRARALRRTIVASAAKSVFTPFQSSSTYFSDSAVVVPKCFLGQSCFLAVTNEVRFNWGGEIRPTLMYHVPGAFYLIDAPTP